MLNILPLALLIVIWWVGVWGLIETIIHQYIRGSPAKAIMIYSSMIALVIGVVYLNPKIIDYFL